MRKKSALRKITLHSLSWGARHTAALKAIKDNLRNAVELAFPKLKHVVCVYTEASEEVRAAVVTRTKEENLGIPIE